MKQLFRYLCIGATGTALAFYNIGCGGSNGATATRIYGTVSTGSSTATLAYSHPSPQGISESLFAYMRGELDSYKFATILGSSVIPTAHAAFKTGAVLSGATITVKDLAGNALFSTTASSVGEWTGTIEQQNLDGYYVEVTDTSLTHPLRKLGGKILSAETSVNAGDINESTTAITKIIETVSGLHFPSSTAATAASAASASSSIGLTELVNVFNDAVNSNPTGPVANLVDLVQKNDITGSSENATVSFANLTNHNTTLLSALREFNNASAHVNNAAVSSTATGLTASQTAVARLGTILSEALDLTSIQYVADISSVLAGATAPDTIANSLSINDDVLSMTSSSVAITLSSFASGALSLAPSRITAYTYALKENPLNDYFSVSASSYPSSSISGSCASGACSYTWSVLDASGTQVTTAKSVITGANNYISGTFAEGAYTLKVQVSNSVGTIEEYTPFVVVPSFIVSGINAPKSWEEPSYEMTNSSVLIFNRYGYSGSVTTEWSLLAKPATSALSFATTSANSGTFTPDVAGTYVFQFKLTGSYTDLITRSFIATSGTTPTAAPTSLSATGGTSPTPAVSLTWNEVSGANGYYVYRNYSSAPSASATPIAVTTAPYFTDRTILSSTFPYGSGYYTVAPFSLPSSFTTTTRTSPLIGPQATAVYCYGYSANCQ